MPIGATLQIQKEMPMNLGINLEDILAFFVFFAFDSGSHRLSPILDYECSRICGLHQHVVRLTVKETH